MASTNLTRTQGTGSSYDIWTLSMWVKRSGLGSLQGLMSTAGGWNTGGGMAIMFSDTDVINIYNPSQGSSGGNYNQCTRLFKDTNAWYHLVFRADSTQGTQADRMKVYINGVQETTFNMGNLPSQGTDWNNVNRNGETLQIGRGGNGGSTFFDGSMTHVYFIDGTSYDASAFGETDATTGEWVAKTSPSVNYGNNGFLILKDGNTITDQSSNSNDFTLGSGTLTDLKDNPENVFATWNPLDGLYQGGTGSNGNTTWQTANSLYSYRPATLGVSSGKFYWEVKYVAKSGGDDYPVIGITSNQTATNTGVGDNLNDWGWYIGVNTSYLRNNNSSAAWGTVYSVGDIVGVALDCDNNKLYFSKNGVFQESGNPSSGSNGVSITAPSSTPLGLYFPAFTYYDGTYNGTFSANFGNGYFGTTAVATNSGNGYSGAEGSSKFNYTVPTGYSALSTKGLNE